MDALLVPDVTMSPPRAEAKPEEALPPTTVAVGPEARLAALDGLRGIAITLVLIFHLSLFGGLWLSHSPLDRWVWKATSAGWAGVDLFFVLSGFLITGILYDAKLALRAVAGKAGYFRTFYARRVLRIFPAYYAFLAMLIVVLPLANSQANEAATSIREHVWVYLLYLTNMRDAMGEVRPESLYADHGWSLAVEEQFYLVWPFVVLLFKRRALMAICGLAIVAAFVLRLALVLAGTNGAVPYVLMPARMDTLAIGALIALAARDASDLRALMAWARPLAVAAALALLAIAIAHGGLTAPYGGWILTAGFSAVAWIFGAFLLIVLTAPQESAIGSVLSPAAPLARAV